MSEIFKTRPDGTKFIDLEAVAERRKQERLAWRFESQMEKLHRFQKKETTK